VRIDILERRAIDGSRILILVGTLLLSVPSTGAGAEEFEVLVMRGSTVARVAGDETGPLSEVTIREDPHPPAPRAPEERPFEPEVTIRIEQGETERYAGPSWRYPLRRPFQQREPPRYRLHDWGSRHVHGSYRLGGRPPRSVLFGGPKGLRSHRR
jgi:hypothetical protein